MLAAIVAVNAHCIVVCGMTQAPMSSHCHGHSCAKCAPEQPPFAKGPAQTFAPAVAVVDVVAGDSLVSIANVSVSNDPVNTGPPLSAVLRV